mmetsp:Transcript_27924/g.91837  ORF Transcript_27924/g.91837 Transcript_27924/m.91837 type:complete len:493 (-) Transcript_27924:127-1605(-)
MDEARARSAPPVRFADSGRRSSSGGVFGAPALSRRSSAEEVVASMAESLHCPITNALLVDPVSAADGFIYERDAVSRWLSSHDTSPNTGAVLPNKALVALPAVRAMVLSVVDSDTLPEDEVREWLLRRGVWAAGTSNRAEAKELLQRALGAGCVEAGYHLGRMLIEEAAAAGMAEAVAAQERLESSGGGRGRGASAFAIGGVGGDCDEEGGETGLCSVERYEPAARAWLPAPPMRTARSEAAAAALGGRIYVAGGNGNEARAVLREVEVLDAATLVWSHAPSMRTARSAAIAAVLGGRVLVAGGVDENYERLRSVEAFEPVASTWSAVSPMLEARCEAAAAVLDGTLYVCGGNDRVGGCLRSVERLNEAGAWEAAPPMLCARRCAVAAALDGLLYVCGGRDEDSGCLQSVECYDPATGEWRDGPPMGSRRRGAVAAVLEGALYVCGGDEDCDGAEAESPVLRSVECLVAGASQWQPAPSMAMARWRAAMAVL